MHTAKYVWNLNNTLKKLNNTLWHWRPKQRRKKEALLMLPSVPLVLDGRTVSTFTGASTLGRLPHVANGCMNCGCREVNDYLEHKLHVFKFVSSFSLSLWVFFFFFRSFGVLFHFSSPKCCHSSCLCSNIIHDGWWKNANQQLELLKVWKMAKS